MKKRGGFTITNEMFLMFPRLLLLGVVILFITSVLSSYIHRDIQTEELESHLILTRALYSPNCLSYSDDIISQPGIIDLTRFKPTIISSCIKSNNGMRFTLKEIDSDTILSSFIVNNDIFNEWPLCKIEKKKFDCLVESNYVLIKDNNNLKPALLIIEILKK